MRLFMDGVIALMLVIVLGGILVHQRARAAELHEVEIAQRSVRSIQSQALYRGSLREDEVTRRGYPLVIDAMWFKTRPTNPLALDATDWIEVVTEADAELLNPKHITTDRCRAAFWYNPHRGLVRARITRHASEQATVELYNLVNGTSLRVADVQQALTASTPAAR